MAFPAKKIQQMAFPAKKIQHMAFPAKKNYNKWHQCTYSNLKKE